MIEWDIGTTFLLHTKKAPVLHMAIVIISVPVTENSRDLMCAESITLHIV